MKQLRIKANSLLSRYVPEQRIYFRTESSTRYLRMSPLMQTVAGGFTAVFVSWAIIATAALTIDMISADSDKTQTKVLQRFYEARLNELSDERDTRAIEAQKAQQRFYVALDQISLQQSELLQAEEERRELATGLKIMQRKLQTAIKERDVAEKQSDTMLAELQAVTGSLNTKLGTASDTEDTLNLLSTALNETVQERDTIAKDRITLKQHVNDLEFDAKIREERNNRIFTRLEEAVTVSLSPLEKVFKRSGLSTDTLLKEVRRGYSGTGGPLTPLSVSTKGTPDYEESERVNGLLKQMDRINLMQMAAARMPLGVPVKGRFRYSSGYGMRSDPKSGGRRMHNGRDMAGQRGTPIVASGDGVVTFAGRQSGYGNLIKIRHPLGFETRYAHLNKIRVKSGQRVSRGQRIGDMGTTGRSTGVHLHYEIRIGGKPVNPLTYMKAAQDVF